MEDLAVGILLSVLAVIAFKCNMDSRERFDRNSHCDGMLEVIGLSDVLHMGQVQVGMDEPFMVGQGKVIKIKSK